MRYFSLLFLLLLVNCGSSTTSDLDAIDSSVATQTAPIILRVAPTSGRVGDTVTIFGFGFSVAAPENIVTVGGKGTSAQTYTLLANPTNGEAESLAFQIPTGAATGAAAIFVTVFELTSNANVQFTLNP